MDGGDDESKIIYRRVNVRMTVERTGSRDELTARGMYFDQCRYAKSLSIQGEGGEGQEGAGPVRASHGQECKTVGQVQGQQQLSKST